MKIRVGYELIYDFPQSTPIVMVLGIHFTRAPDVIVPDYLTTSPSVPIFPYRDVFGNWCSRIVAPAGRMRLSADGVVRDTGLPDVVAASHSSRHHGWQQSANFGLMHCSGTADRRAQLLAARLGKFAQRTPKITSIFKVRAHRKLPRARIQQAQVDKCAVTHASAALRVVRAVVQPRPPVAETGARVQLFDAARLLPRSRKTPAMGHASATSMPHLRRDGHDAPDDAPDRIGRDGRARVGAPPSACGEERRPARQRPLVGFVGAELV
jgi:hypothetical protein